MKKMIRTLAVVFMLMGVLALTANASASIRKVEYEGNGKVDVDFYASVNYRKVKVTVKDSKGKKIGARIIERDDDDLSFVISGHKPGKKYRFTIKGIKRIGEGVYGSVSGSFRIPSSKGSIPVREVEYDAEDRDVDFSFGCRVEWKKPKVTVTDGSRHYNAWIKDLDDDDLEVKVDALTRGKTYRYTITGIRRVGSTSYTTVSGSFTAW